MPSAVVLTGGRLTPAEVETVARDGARVEIDPIASERLRASRAVVERALAANDEVYGLTTGLGARVGRRLDEREVSEFSARTLRGRATAVGPPLTREAVRAAMVVRLNGFCAGGAGVSPPVAEALAALLNAGVHPVIPASGSLGAADLCLLAHLGLVLIGEGEAELEGERMPGAQALAQAGIALPPLQPKDGLAICSSSAVSAGLAALALVTARELLDAAQVAAALSMEGFRANVSPLAEPVVAARPAPGQAWAAGGLRSLLAGGQLPEPGAARRLQDPLSFRCVSQVHGAMHWALDQLGSALEAELGGAADNPLVLIDEDELISNGNFHTAALALALDGAAIAVAQAGAPMAERPARLASERMSGLPANLTPLGAGRSGIAPLIKTAVSLTVEIRHRAAPTAVDPRVGADGVEDDSTNAVQGALRLHEQLDRLRLLVALELVCAAQAVELAGAERLGTGTAAAYAVVRELVEPLDDDRPLGPDVERVAGSALTGGRLLASVREAIA